MDIDNSRFYNLFFNSTIAKRENDLINSGDIEKQRFLFYSGKLDLMFTERSLAVKDTKLYYSITNKNILFNPKSGLYVKIKQKKGFTLDYENKTFKIWFGDNIMVFFQYFDEIFKHLNIDWVESKYYPLIRKNSFKNILLGKFTNPTQLLKYYLKTSVKLKKGDNVNHKLILNNIRILNNNLRNIPDWYHNSTNNLDDIIKKLIELTPNIGSSDRFNLITDIIKQCKSLNEKINCNWSLNRLKNEHTILNRKIINLNLEFISDNKVDYDGQLLNIPFDGVLLTTEKEIFIEGSEQNHCVHSNYWNSVKNKRNFIISVKKPYRHTIMVGKSLYGNLSNNDEKFKILQNYGYKNEIPPKEHIDAFHTWVSNADVQEFFLDNFNALSLHTESVDVDINPF